MTERKTRRLSAEAIQFLLDGRNPSEIIKSDRVLFNAVMDIIINDPPKKMAVTDPNAYRRLREQVTRLRIQGWGI